MANDKSNANASTNVGQSPLVSGITDASRTEDFRWHCLRRISEIDAEYRIAFFRVLALTLLYLIHLAFYQRDDQQPAALTYHRIVSLVTLASASISFLTIVVLWRRFFPRWIAVIIVAGDLLCVCSLAATRPTGFGPMVPLFAVIIITAGLRFRLELVWISTLIGMLCFGAVLMMRKGQQAIPTTVDDRLDQLLWGSEILLVGIIVGQIVRRVHQLGRLALSAEKLPQHPYARASQDAGTASQGGHVT